MRDGSLAPSGRRSRLVERLILWSHELAWQPLEERSVAEIGNKKIGLSIRPAGHGHQERPYLSSEPTDQPLLTLSAQEAIYKRMDVPVQSQRIVNEPKRKQKGYVA